MDISIDTSGLTKFLTDFEQRQVPYALSLALNDTAELMQYRERQHISDVMTIRRKQWADQNVKITKFARKNDLTAVVEIKAPGDGSRSDVLGKFESSTQKTPAKGGKSIAVPMNAKQNAQGIIAQGNRPKAFHFKRVGGKGALDSTHHASKRIKGGVGRGALEVYEGDKKTVLIRNAQGKGVILQRVGRGKRAGMKLLYFLTPKVKLTPNLDFVDTAREAATHFADFFKARFAEAMYTAKR